MRCDQCKHWRNDEHGGAWESKEIGFKLCHGVRERWRIQDVASEGMEYGDPYIEKRKEALKAAGAYVEDGSEYKALLWTAPDFFCALFANAHRSNK